jgi:hypothetical protein
MSEEFETWFKQEMESGNLIAFQDAKEGFEAAQEIMQANLDAKDKEMEALREFAKDMLLSDEDGYNKMVAFKYGIVGSDGKPTPLLTGDK